MLRRENMKSTDLTDLHIHIIPGVDDGSQSEEMTEQMLQMAIEQNITTIIATPHYKNGMSQKRVLHAYERLKEIAETKAPSIRIFLGNEILLSEETPDDIKKGRVFSLANSKYYLIETLPQTEYKRLYGAMQEVIVMGCAPVLAHLERYECLRQRTDRIKELVEVGCYLQVNAETVMLPFYQPQYRWIKGLLKQNLVHFIATDAHNVSRRKPELLPAMLRCQKILSEEQVNRIFYQNPQKILNNEFI